MSALWRHAIDVLRSSYWVVPACMVLLAIALASIVRALGQSDALDAWGVIRWFSELGAEGARSMLTTIAASVLGVAGVTFSITIVAVSFASANHGPRLINSFMRDRGSQVTLGMFISTFVYCLLILPALHSGDAGAAIDAGRPSAAIPVAVALMLLCIAMLIYFLQHATEIMNIENIAASIGHELTASVGHGFPDESDGDEDKTQARPDTTPPGITDVLPAEDGGYVQTVDLDALEALAQEHELRLTLHYRPGDFLVPGAELLRVEARTALNAKLRRQLLGCVVTGRQRTEPQNLLFKFDQLIEVVIRALSPGVNDPSTAITCLNWMRLPLKKLLSLPPRSDHDSPSRVSIKPLKAVDILDHVFDRLREHVAQDSTVTCHTLGILGQLELDSGCEPHRRAVREQIETLGDAARQRQADSISRDRVRRCLDEVLGRSSA